MKKKTVNQKIQLRNLLEGNTERQKCGKYEGVGKTQGGKNKKVPHTIKRTSRGENR